jgi:hypothetical protein
MKLAVTKTIPYQIHDSGGSGYFPCECPTRRNRKIMYTNPIARKERSQQAESLPKGRILNEGKPL